MGTPIDINRTRIRKEYKRTVCRQCLHVSAAVPTWACGECLHALNAHQARGPMTRLSARQRGYDSRWDKARKTFLASHPWCAFCLEHDVHTKASVVDHKTPHKGNQALFWATSKWQSLCQSCHNSAKRTEELTGKRGRIKGVDANGWPLWRRGE